MSENRLQFTEMFPDALTAAVAAKFGLHDPGSVAPPTIALDETSCDALGAGGHIIACTGPSGSGKTMLLHAIRKKFRRAVDLDSIVIDPNATPTKQVGNAIRSANRAGSRPFKAPTVEMVLPWLSRCGLGEAHLLVRPARTLSQGETFRLRLALALAGGAKMLVIDEFASVLDDIVAAVVARQLRKLADSIKLSIAVAAPRDNFIADLRPDTWLRFSLNAPPQKAPSKALESARKADPLRSQIEIVSGSRADWPAFSRWHYRSHALGFVSHVYCLHHRGLGENIGIIVYAHPPLQAKLRSAFLKKHRPDIALPTTRASREWADWFNHHFRVLHRIVIDPRFRGAGLGALLTQQTVGKLGVPFVECFTTLGGYSGFLESAGFRREGRSEASTAVTALCDFLADRGFSAGELDSPQTLAAFVNRLKPADSAELDARFQLALRRRLAAFKRKFRHREIRPSADPLFFDALKHLVLERDLTPFYFIWMRDHQPLESAKKATLARARSKSCN